MTWAWGSRGKIDCDIRGGGSDDGAMIVPEELMIGCEGMWWSVEGSRLLSPNSTEQANLTRGGGGRRRSKCSSISAYACSFSTAADA